MKTRLLVEGVAALTLGGADAASAYLSANTIDGHATHTNDGARVRATGPIGCTRGERVSIRVIVSQAATGARAAGGDPPGPRPGLTSARGLAVSSRQAATSSA
jgi:hypothetical protein